MTTYTTKRAGQNIIEVYAGSEKIGRVIEMTNGFNARHALKHEPGEFRSLYAAVNHIIGQDRLIEDAFLGAIEPLSPLDVIESIAVVV